MNPLGSLQRNSIYASCGVLFLSGILWALVHYVPELAGLREREARACAAVLMKAHGAAGMVILVFLGALAASHVPRGWKQQRNLVSGVVVVTLAALLAITGYLLYYAGDEAIRSIVSGLHLVFGIAAAVPLVFHVLARQPHRSASEEQRRHEARCYTARPSAERGVPR